MADEIWEVVGGADKGGILVREGRDLKSKELSERLATGALVRQRELEGERLRYELLAGRGPAAGWVSTRLKEKDLLVKSDGSPPALPVLVCFYSGGFTAAQGRGQLKFFLDEARKAGLVDSVVLDHIGEAGFQDCRDWEAYVGRLAARLDEDTRLRGRPVFVVAHSHGTVPAYGLAKRLGARCMKLYVVARRPPNGALLDEVWGVDSAPQVLDLDDEVLLRGMLDAWPNNYLEDFRNVSPLPAHIKDVIAVVKRQYGSPALPCGSADAPGICGVEPAIEAPILAVAASQEAEPKGETASKMEGWRDFTTRTFELKMVEGTHMGMLSAQSPMYDIVLSDIKALMQSM